MKRLKINAKEARVGPLKIILDLDVSSMSIFVEFKEELIALATLEKDRPIDSKLKRTNLMKRRESQALLEGVRKNRCLSPPNFSPSNR